MLRKVCWETTDFELANNATEPLQWEPARTGEGNRWVKRGNMLPLWSYMPKSDMRAVDRRGIPGQCPLSCRRPRFCYAPGKWSQVRILPGAQLFPQFSNAAPSSRRTMVREDWALVAVAGCAGWGGDWSGSSW